MMMDEYIITMSSTTSNMHLTETSYQMQLSVENNVQVSKETHIKNTKCYF
jgi:hypothetical protein